MSEDEPQVDSVKKTCGSELEVRGRRHGVSHYKKGQMSVALFMAQFTSDILAQWLTLLAYNCLKLQSSIPVNGNNYSLK